MLAATTQASKTTPDRAQKMMRLTAQGSATPLKHSNKTPMESPIPTPKKARSVLCHHGVKLPDLSGFNSLAGSGV